MDEIPLAFVASVLTDAFGVTQNCAPGLALPKVTICNWFAPRKIAALPAPDDDDDHVAWYHTAISPFVGRTIPVTWSGVVRVVNDVLDVD
jgi:hypothetical protein